MPFFNFSFGKDKISKPDFVTPSQQKAVNVTAAAFQWLDANNVLVETMLTIKLLTKEVESGIAVFRLTKTGTAWKLSGVETFEVR